MINLNGIENHIKNQQYIDSHFSTPSPNVSLRPVLDTRRSNNYKNESNTVRIIQYNGNTLL